MNTSHSDLCPALTWGDVVNTASTASSGYSIRQIISRVTNPAKVKTKVYVVGSEMDDEICLTLISSMHDKMEAEGPYSSFKTVDELLDYLKRTK